MHSLSAALKIVKGRDLRASMYFRGRIMSLKLRYIAMRTYVWAHCRACKRRMYERPEMASLVNKSRYMALSFSRVRCSTRSDRTETF